LERDGALAKSRLLPDDEEALPTNAAVKPTRS
jgi:hypothetical protein